MNIEEQSKFLGKLYDMLIREEIIKDSDKPKDLKTKVERAKKYFEKLQRVQEKTFDSERYLQMIKSLYYDRYVIKEKDIPESYLRNLESRYLNEGYGHVNLVNPQNDRDEYYRNECIGDIIRTQKDSLSSWLNYFLSTDSEYLPMWAKVWAFQGMLKIGNLEDDKSGYKRRSNVTVNPFVELDSEILARCFELLNVKQMTDDDLDKLVRTGNFSKLYGSLLSKKKQIKRTGIKGIWIKYNRETEKDALKKEKSGIEPEYMKLYNSLQLYNTGWCTAGSKETAMLHINGGDFYVYYSIDENGEYKIPRIAIRMNGNAIREIRGIAPSQNIESDMEIILEEKLKEFPDASRYKKKVNDMKILTEIYQKYINHIEFTKEELRFLYEIDTKIDGFGYDDDPRIAEIIKFRSRRRDLSIIFDCNEDEIGLSKSDLNRKLVYYDGNIELSDLSNLEQFGLPKYVVGYLNLDGLTSIDGLMLPEKVGWDLHLGSLKTAEGLVLPKSIGGSLNLNGLTTAKGLVIPQHISSCLYLNSLTSADGLVFPKSIDGGLYLNGLTTVKGVKLPQSIGGHLELRNLKTAEELVLPEKIGGHLDLNSLISLKDVTFPQDIVCGLLLGSLTTAEGLRLPDIVGGNLVLKNLTTTDGLVLPKSVGGCLDLSNLETVDGLVLPQNVGGYLDLESLTNAEGLVLPQSIGGNLLLDSLTTAKDISFPQRIGDSLYMNSLTNAKDISLPHSIGGNLELRNLINAEGLVLPESVGGLLNLANLASLMGNILPKDVGDAIYCKGQYYDLDEFYNIQKEEQQLIGKKKLRQKGFTSNIFIIFCTLLISVLSVIFAIIFIKY